MAAPKKITPEMETEILRRRAAGEGIVPIAVDLDIAHQTVSKITKRDAQKRATDREPERHSTAPRKPQAPKRQRSEPAKQIVRHPLLPTVFANRDERLAYYQHHKLESQNDWLNYNDAIRGRETPAERRARTRGTPLPLRG